MYYNLCIINIRYICHLCATQALAWVHVALPRGLACHVASTWVQAINAPHFALFFINLNAFKIENTLK